MARAKRYIPEGLQTATASLVIDGAAKAIEWYRNVFGANLRHEPFRGPDGKIAHSEIQIGSSVLFVNDLMQGAPSDVQDARKLGGSPLAMVLYFEDADAVFKRAIENGAKVHMPIADQFWGDRWGGFTDPFGLHWAVATRREDLTPAEMEQRARKFYEQMGRKR